MAGTMTGNPWPNKEGKKKKKTEKTYMLPVLPQVMSITPLLTTVDKNRNLNPGAQFLSLSLSLSHSCIKSVLSP